ncbi:MAG: phosphoglucomutase/phosphomannomutase family protein [bacterium]
MIKFGTDGWRAVISNEFTFENVRKVAQAYCNYLIKNDLHRSGIVIGYDNRFESENFAFESAKIAASNDIKVYLLENSVPSPVVSFVVREKALGGGIMITASHNPPQWNGFKIKSQFACSASSDITKAVEAEVANVKAPVISANYQSNIAKIDPKDGYFQHISKFVDFSIIKRANMNIIIDPMHGSGAGYVKEILSKNGIDCVQINNIRDPLFGGVNPEPIPLNLTELSDLIKEGSLNGPGLWIGLATDGDGDRIGGVDGSGGFLTSHDMFVLLLKHLVENKKLSGSVIKTFNITNLVGMLANKYGLTVHETPIGFKYIADHMLKEDVLIGGEESGGIGIKGHIPERDGVLNSLLMLECLAYYKKDARAILNSVMDEFGYFYYDRIDVHLTDEQRTKIKQKIGGFRPSIFIGEKVTDIQDLDGIKMFLGDKSWILFRLSGTEPLIRIYCEATSSDKVKRMLAEGEKLILG